MKIAIDVSLAIGESAGVGTYTRGLIEGLAAIDADNEYVLYSYLDFPPLQQDSFPQLPNFSLQMLPLRGEHWERLWAQADLPPKAALDPVDVLHSPFFNAPREHRGALVVTIYDASFLLQPQLHTEANRLHCLQGTLKAALHADRIIAISQQTKTDLMDYFAVPEAQIRVIYPAHRGLYYPEGNREVLRETLARLGIFHNFILFVGSLEPRKNLKTLLRAYAAYVMRHGGEELLVVAGGKGWLNGDLTQVAVELGIADRVKLLGYVQEPDLRVLYSAARLFVYPSIYEGFGLPPLEAMACGAPVITSDVSALPEVVGDAGLLIDPHNSAALLEAMVKVLCDPELRMRMRQRSLARATCFSWQRTAAETLAVYEEVCPAHSRATRIE
jgi:glycosyltransferase involved in cell wall biosynthesis